jgi:O-antigen ligase
MKLLTKKTWLVLGVITLIEFISFGAYFYAPLKIIGALLLTAATLFLTFKNLENGLLILFAELIIGSKGHLFEIGPVSIRVLIFSVIMVAYLIKLTKKENRQQLFTTLKEIKSWRYLAILAFFALSSLAIAFIRGNILGNIFSDFNNWLFFLLFFPILSVYYQAKPKVYENLAVVTTAAFLWLSLETLIILYIFTHNLGIMPDLYLWLRRTGIAEITPTLGSWPRIFLQSHIYAAIALAIIPFVLDVKKYSTWLLITLAWSVCLLSMSRSFWLASAAVLAGAVILQIIFFGWRKIWSKIFLIGGGFVASIILILFIVFFPIPKPGTFSTGSFVNRVSLDSGEAAVASRWSLLPVMWHEIEKSPIIGFGYGKTITYKSSDPRVLQVNPDGQYTTYAFEWGYLSLWLKLGLLGLLAYMALIFSAVYKSLIKWHKKDFLAGALGLGIMILVITNFFTPYLDHPLGIGYLLLAFVLIQTRDMTLPEVTK